MDIDQALKNVLELLDKILIPGSESVKMMAVKNDIAAVRKHAKQMQEDMQEQLDEARNKAEEMALLLADKEVKVDED